MSDYEDEILAERYLEKASWSMIASNDEGLDYHDFDDAELAFDDAIEM